MTRTYALKRLLEHGAMLRSEITACTGWDRRAVHRALQAVLDTEVVRTIRIYDARTKRASVAYVAVACGEQGEMAGA